MSYEKDIDTTCWICLDECTPDHGNNTNNNSDTNPWFRPCSCPRLCHRICLARWCLQQVGRSGEKTCRFCNDCLPDWKSNLVPPGSIDNVIPKIGIMHNGQTHLVDVEPGDAGRQKFLLEVRKRLNIPSEHDFDVSFECCIPSNLAFGGRTEFKGMDTYDAAVFCAALMAVERMKKARK